MKNELNFIKLRGVLNLCFHNHLFSRTCRWNIQPPKTKPSLLSMVAKLLKNLPEDHKSLDTPPTSHKADPKETPATISDSEEKISENSNPHSTFKANSPLMTSSTWKKSLMPTTQLVWASFCPMIWSCYWPKTVSTPTKKPCMKS